MVSASIPHKVGGCKLYALRGRRARAMSKYRKMPARMTTPTPTWMEVVPLAQVASLEDGLRTAIPFKETTLALEDVRVLELRVSCVAAPRSPRRPCSAGYMKQGFDLRDPGVDRARASPTSGVVWLYWTFQSEVLTRGQFACDVFWYTTYIIMGPLPILRGWLLIHRFRLCRAAS